MADRKQKTAAMGLMRGNHIPSAHFHGTVLIAVHSPIQVRNRANPACGGRNRARQCVLFVRIGHIGGEKGDGGSDGRVRCGLLVSGARIQPSHLCGTAAAPVRSGRAQHGRTGTRPGAYRVRRRRGIPQADGSGGFHLRRSGPSRRAWRAHLRDRGLHAERTRIA